MRAALQTPKLNFKDVSNLHKNKNYLGASEALFKTHTTRIGGVLGSHHKLRSKVVLKPEAKKGFNKNEHNQSEEDSEEKKICLK